MHIKDKDLPQVKPVKLKPLFGLEPGKWLTILYALILFLVVFLVGFLPDIVHGSKRVSFYSENCECAVYLDDAYIGGTPFTKKIPSGKHNVVYAVNNNTLDSFEIEVSHPVFFAWLFPRHMEVSRSCNLTKDAYDSLTREFINDVASYSAINDYSVVYRYPDLFTSYVNNTIKCDFFDSKVLNYACLFITTDEMKQDAQNAYNLASINKTVEIKSSDKIKYSVPSVDSYQDCYLINNSFFVSRLPVSEAQYKNFITENPKWALDNKENLISEGLVDDFYLADFTGSSLKAVTNISYYAAQEYCKWLSKKTGNNVYLPTEKQWILASLVADPIYQKTLLSASSLDKPISMFGGVWEMTQTCYVPQDSSSDSPIQSYLKSIDSNAEIIVKGGSYINKSQEITSYTTGTSPRNLCSDYMGFRVFWN